MAESADATVVSSPLMSSLWIHAPMQAPRRLGQETPSLTVGRTPENGLILNDPAISRSHARFTWEGGTLWLQDLGSRHGSFVNGQRLQTRCKVGAGDEIRLGPVVLRVEGDTLPSPAPSAGQTRTVALAELRHRPEGEESSGHGALDLLHALSMDLLRDVAPDAMVERLLRRLTQRLHAKQAVALLRDATGAIRILGPEGLALPAPDGLTAEMMDAAFQRQEASLVLNPWGGETGSSTASSMTVPLEHQGEVFGLLHFRSESGTPFQAEDLRLVATLGNLVAARILRQQALDEVTRRQELERDLETREAATRARAAFLANLSHELRSPLQALLSYQTLALQETRPERIPRHLAGAEKAGQMLLELVNNILDFSKVEAGRLALEAIPFKLQEVLETAEALCLPAANRKGLRLDWHLDGAIPPRILGDPLRLGQVLMNLTGNAVKFTPQGSVAIVVTLLPQEGRIAFEVTDTGIGLTEAEQAGIFDPYQQAQANTARAYGGTGLGLAISRQLVTLMGGTLSVQSTPGQGSTFRFSVPCLPADVLAMTPDLTSAPPALFGRVLVVEDDTINRELVTHILKLAGLDVVGAPTGAEALAILQTTRVQAVVTDLSLPDLEGPEIVARIRALPGYAGLPAVTLTGHDSVETQARCLAAGMQGHLVKPVRPSALLDLLRPWLSTPGGRFVPEADRLPGQPQPR